jgi:hypothetical protein
MEIETSLFQLIDLCIFYYWWLKSSTPPHRCNVNEILPNVHEINSLSLFLHSPWSRLCIQCYLLVQIILYPYVSLVNILDNNSIYDRPKVDASIIFFSWPFIIFFLFWHDMSKHCIYMMIIIIMKADLFSVLSKYEKIELNILFLVGYLWIASCN